MADNGAVAEKAFDPAALKRTVQVPPANPQVGGGYDYSVLYLAAAYGDEFVPWGPRHKERDQQLRAFIDKEPLFASALGIVVSRNSAFAWKLEGPDELVKHYHDVLTNANFGKGWVDLIAKVTVDLSTQDNGAFIEIIREKDAPDAKVVGIAHLDAAHCWHTGVPEIPVIYHDREGQYHYLKWYQVVTLAEMPATYEGLPGLQWCALTRMLRSAQMLRDVGLYLSEKIGGKNMRAVTMVKGVKAEEIQRAWQVAQASHDAKGLMRFTMPVMVSSVDPNADIGFSTFEIASLPDGFDLDLTQKQYIAQIAMAFLSDYQDFAPLPGGGLGTSAQSQILHQKTRGKGPALFQKLITQALNFFVLPEELEFRFDEDDLEGEAEEAGVRKTRADERATRLAAGEISPAVAQDIAYHAGDLSDEQFEQLKAEAEEAKRKEEEQAALAAEQEAAGLAAAEELAQAQGLPAAAARVPGALPPPQPPKPLQAKPIASASSNDETAEGSSTTASQSSADDDDQAEDEKKKAATPTGEPPRLTAEKLVAQTIDEAFAELLADLQATVGPIDGVSQKHRPGGKDHPQEEHGNWAAGRMSTRKIVTETIKQGGTTYSVLTRSKPKGGFAVSLYEERSTPVPVERFNDYRVERFKRDNLDLLREPGNYIGTWKDDETGKVWLDVTRVEPDRAKAIDLAREHDQIAIFDLDTFEEITVNRDAKSGQKALEEASKASPSWSPWKRVRRRRRFPWSRD